MGESLAKFCCHDSYFKREKRRQNFPTSHTHFTKVYRRAAQKLFDQQQRHVSAKIPYCPQTERSKFEPESGQTSTKVITKADQNITMLMRAHKKTKSTAWKAQENVTHQLAIVLALNLIGCKGGENCPDQSQNAVEQNQSNSSFLSTLDWKLFKYGKNPLCTWFSFAQDHLYWTYKWYNTITLVIMLRFDDVRFDLTSNWSKYKWLYYHWWDQTWRVFWPIREVHWQSLKTAFRYNIPSYGLWTSKKSLVIGFE